MQLGQIAPFLTHQTERGPKRTIVEGGIHMKDFLKAIRAFLRRIQFTVTLKTPFVDFSFALLLIRLLLIGSFQ